MSSRLFLVTAGGTRERIDQVRQWGNTFTGGTGLAIARALAPLGSVDLLTSNVEHLRELQRDARDPNLTATGFGSHEELKQQLAECMSGRRYDAVFMTAAVSDYQPAGVFEIVTRENDPNGGERWIVRNVQAAKVKSSYLQIAVVGQRTEKLIDLFRTAWGYRGLLVKFKLEVGVKVAQLLEIGRASRVASGADYLVANTLEMVEGADAGAYLIGPEDQAEFIPRHQLAIRLAALVKRDP